MQNRRAERLRIAAEVDVPQRDVEQESGDAPHLPAARGKKPPSLWDWKTWTMAKPRLWRYGDAGNLCERNTDLSTSERAACLLLREELAYTVHGEHDDGKEVVRPGMGSPPVQNLSEAVQPGMGSRPLQNPSEAAQPGMGSQLTQNRFSGDWTALHMMATVSRLIDQRAVAYNFLRNGGMAFAKKLERLSAEDLASAARVAPEAGGTDQFFKEAAVPQTVKDVLHTMSSASVTVVGTDGRVLSCSW